MVRILITESSDYPDEAHSILKKCGKIIEKDFSRRQDRTQLLKSVKDVDVLLVKLAHRIDKEVIDSAKNLRVIVSPTTGLDHIDIDYSKVRHIKILSLRNETKFLRSIHSTAEHTWALLLALIRRIVPANISVREGEWNRDLFFGAELNGKRLGIVGFGRIGSMIARFGLAFGMEVFAYDPLLRKSEFLRGVRRTSSLPELLSQSDILSLHVHLSPETERLIGAEQFKLLPKGAILINTARGRLVDENALVHALRTGHLAGAALDVIAEEPSVGRTGIIRNYAFNVDNVLITPHIGGATHEARKRTDIFMAQKLFNLLSADRL